MPRWGRLQPVFPVFILGLVFMMLAVLGGCGSAQNSGPSAPTPAESPADNPASESENDEAPQEEAKDPQPLENDAFRVKRPTANEVVGMTIRLEGESRTFEGNFRYTVEDGHNILADGHVQTSAGAPEWAIFSTEIQLQEAPTSPNGVLILFEPSPKDGQPTHQLVIPLTFDETIVNLE